MAIWMEGCDRPSKEVKGHFCSIKLTWKVIRHKWNVQVHLSHSVPSLVSLGEEYISLSLFKKQNKKLYFLCFSLLFNHFISTKRSLRKENGRQWDFGNAGKRAWESPCRKRATSITAPDLLSSSHSLSHSLYTWSRNNGHFLLLSLETGSWNDRMNNHERERAWETVL